MLNKLRGNNLQSIFVVLCKEHLICGSLESYFYGEMHKSTIGSANHLKTKLEDFFGLTT